MVRLVTGTVAAAILGVAVVAAQEPVPQKPAQPPAVQRPAQPPQPSEVKGDNVTVSGCLRSGTTPGSWILAEASLAPPAGGDPRPAGTTGATKSYALMAKPSEDLSKHSGHKIEVTGSVSPSIAKEPTAPKETLNVQSFKMVSATCP